MLRITHLSTSTTRIARIVKRLSMHHQNRLERAKRDCGSLQCDVDGWAAASYQESIDNVHFGVKKMYSELHRTRPSHLMQYYSARIKDYQKLISLKFRTSSLGSA